MRPVSSTAPEWSARCKTQSLVVKFKCETFSRVMRETKFSPKVEGKQNRKGRGMESEFEALTETKIANTPGGNQTWNTQQMWRWLFYFPLTTTTQETTDLWAEGVL